MKKLYQSLILLFCTLSAAQALAQQLPLYSMYNTHGFVFNPAMTAWEGDRTAMVSYRHQWSQMDGAPRTATASFRNWFYQQNLGTGVYVLYDRTGPTSQYAMYGTAAYQFIFDDTYTRRRLAVGMSLSLNQYRLKSSQLVLHDAIDNLVINSDNGKMMPDAGLGIFYTDDKYYGGISVPQVLGLNVKIRGNNGDISNLRRVAHIYSVLGAKFPVGQEESTIEPSIWLRYAPTSPVNVAFNARYHHNNQVHLGVGYSTDNTVLLEAGFTLNEKFTIGYAYSTQFSTLQSSLGTTHEIQLAYRLLSEEEYLGN